MGVGGRVDVCGFVLEIWMEKHPFAIRMLLRPHAQTHMPARPHAHTPIRLPAGRANTHTRPTPTRPDAHAHTRTQYKDCVSLCVALVGR